MFDKVKQHDVSLPDAKDPWTIRTLLVWMRENMLKERPELFVQGAFWQHVWSIFGSARRSTLTTHMCTSTAKHTHTHTHTPQTRAHEDIQILHTHTTHTIINTSTSSQHWCCTHTGGHTLKPLHTHTHTHTRKPSHTHTHTHTRVCNRSCSVPVLACSQSLLSKQRPGGNFQWTRTGLHIPAPRTTSAPDLVHFVVQARACDPGSWCW